MTKPRLSARTLAGSGVGAGRNGSGDHPRLPSWGIKAINRLANECSRPGVYAFALVVRDDGTYQLVVGNRADDLGR